MGLQTNYFTAKWLQLPAARQKLHYIVYIMVDAFYEVNHFELLLRPLHNKFDVKLSCIPNVYQLF